MPFVHGVTVSHSRSDEAKSKSDKLSHLLVYSLGGAANKHFEDLSNFAF